jgi:hypothetical protein
MEKNARTGRLIGAALLSGAVLEGWSNFGLLPQLFDGGGFLANAVGQPRTIGLIIVMGVLAGVFSLWAATMLAVSQKDAFPVHARLYVLFAAVALAATLVELSTLVAMRDVSELFAGAGADAGSRFEIARSILRGLRNGLHFSTKTFEGLNLFVFFVLLFRANAVPLLLAGFGIPAALLQMVAVSRPLFGQEANYTLLAPIGVAYLATALWLLVKGLPRAPA